MIQEYNLLFEEMARQPASSRHHGRGPATGRFRRRLLSDHRGDVSMMRMGARREELQGFSTNWDFARWIGLERVGSLSDRPELISALNWEPALGQVNMHALVLECHLCLQGTSL